MKRRATSVGPGLGRVRRPLGLALAVATLILASQPATAATVNSMNLVDLIQHADTIVAGRVEAVTDGFDGNGVPYTEVTLKVAEKIRGELVETSFTFRQFGLLEPRTLPSGKVALATIPDGWATYSEGEDLTLFLYAPARLTGLRTTVGLKQGKLAVVNGKIKRNEFNTALFDNLSFDPGLLTANEKALVTNGKSKRDIEVDQFVKLVRRAVDEDWVGNGRMRHAN
jgi:hypothetical protein